MPAIRRFIAGQIRNHALVLAACAVAGAVGAGKPASAEPAAARSERLIGYCEQTYRAGSPQLALGICRRVLLLEPEDPAVLWRLGSMLRLLGALHDSVAVYQKALELVPGDAETLYHLGETFAAMGRYDLALSEFERALSAAPKNAKYLNAVGVANDMLGLTARAEQAYRKAIEVSPNGSVARQNLERSQSRKRDGIHPAVTVFSVVVDPQGLRLENSNRAYDFRSPVSEVARVAPLPMTPPDPVVPSRVVPPQASPPQIVSSPAVSSPPVSAPSREVPRLVEVPPTVAEPIEPVPMAGSRDTAPPPYYEGPPRGLGELAVRPETKEPPSPETEVVAEADAEPPLEEDEQVTASLDPLEAGSYSIHLGAFDSQSQAWKGLTNTRASASDVIGDLNLYIRRTKRGGGQRDIFVLSTDPLPDKSVAEDLCSALNKRQITCNISESPAANS